MLPDILKHGKSPAIVVEVHFIPIFVISSGLSIFIPLYILSLGGTVFDVGVAVALFYLVSIPSSLYFGSLTDRTGKTKPFILLSLLFTLPIIALFLFHASVRDVWIYYAMYAVAATAASPALNILVIGRKKRKRKLPKYFSKYSVFGLVGSLIAYVLGLAITDGALYMYVSVPAGVQRRRDYPVPAADKRAAQGHREREEEDGKAGVLDNRHAGHQDSYR